MRRFLNIAWKGFCCAAVLWILALVIAPAQPPKSADMWSRFGVYVSGLMILPPLVVFLGLLELCFGATDSASDHEKKEE